MSFLGNKSAFGQSCSVCSTGCTTGASATSGNCSFAACEGSSSTGIAAAALSNSTATGDTSFAAACSSASGYASSAVSGGSASGDRAFAASNANAFGDESTALSGAAAKGNFSIALGNKSTAYSDYSIAIGRQVDVAINTDNSIVIGYGGTNILSNGIDNSIMLGMNSNVPTLFIEGADGTSGAIGRVGIGLTAPDALLHVEAASAGTEEIARFSVSGVNNNDNYFQIKNESPDNNEMGTMLKAKSKTHSDRPVLMIKAVAGATSTTSTTSIFQFDSRYTGTGTNSRPLFTWTEDNNGNTKMIMDANGNVGIGTNVPSGALDVNGTVYFNANSLGIPDGNSSDHFIGIDIDNNRLIDLGSSTVEFKENVEDIVFDKEAFLNLRPVDFRWKEFYGGNMDVGLIAQEVDEIFPDLATHSFKRTYLPNGDMVRDSIGIPIIDSTQNEVRGVRYHKLPVYLLSIAKDQQTELDSLKQQIQELTSRLDGCCAAVEPSLRLNENNTEAEEDRVEEFILLRNDPNPFSDFTNITYDHQGCAACVIIVSDMSGRIIKRIKTTGSKGTVRIFSSELGSGLFTYSLVRDGQVVRTETMVSSKN